MKAAFIALAVTAGGLAMASTYLVHELGVQRDRVRAETQARQQLEARVKELEQTRKMLEMQIPEPEPAGSVSETAVATLNRPPARVEQKSATAQRFAPMPIDGVARMARPVPRGFGDRSDPRAWLRKQLEDPESRALLRAQHKAGNRMSFPDVGRELGLTEEEQDKLYEMLADQQLKNMEASMQSQPEDFAAVQAAFKQSQTENDAELAAFLGSERFNQFKEYQTTIPERMQIREFRGMLDENNALRDDQAKQLISVLREERERVAKDTAASYNMLRSNIRDGSPPDPAAQAKIAEDNLRAEEAAHKRLHDRAAQILTPAQLARFDEIHEQRLNSIRMSMQMSRQQSSVNGVYAVPAVPLMRYDSAVYTAPDKKE